MSTLHPLFERLLSPTAPPARCANPDCGIPLRSDREPFGGCCSRSCWAQLHDEDDGSDDVYGP